MDISLRLTTNSKLVQLPTMATPCRVWTKGVDKDGYGRVKYKDKTMRAHRLAWRLKHGWRSLSDNELLLHRCDNPPCFEIDHLFKGDTQNNIDDKVAKKRQKGAHRGVKHHNAKLTPEAIKDIIESVRVGPYGTKSAMAVKYNVGKACITKILLGERWKYST